MRDAARRRPAWMDDESVLREQQAEEADRLYTEWEYAETWEATDEKEAA